MNNKQNQFRAWDVKNKKFLPQSHFAILGNGKLIVSDSGYYNHFTNTNKDDYVVVEYIGLTDSQENNIYAGDIIEYNYGNGSRIGYVDFFAGIYHLYNLDKTADDVIGQWLKNELKVIGNIFEHSELLN